MDRQYVLENQVIERYLQGKLSPADEEAFEEAYLADPELLRELQLAERLREGFKSLPEQQRAAPPPPRSRWLEIASSPRYGIAASLVAAAALLSSGVLYLQDQGFGGAGTFAGPSNARVVPLVTVRGSGNPNSIAAPGADEWTVLLVDAGLGDYDSYSAVLTRASSDDELLRLDGMTPSYEGMVALGLPGRLLPPGDYEVRLAGRKNDWPADRESDALSRTPLAVTASR